MTIDESVQEYIDGLEDGEYLVFEDLEFHITALCEFWFNEGLQTGIQCKPMGK